MRYTDQTRLFGRLIQARSIILKKEEQYVNKHHTRFDNDEIFPSLSCCHLPQLLDYPSSNEC